MEQTFPDFKRLYLRIALGVLTLMAIITYILRPFDVSMPFNYFCFGLFLVSTTIYFILKEKKNYLDFDTIFIIFLAIIGFAYPVFIYDETNPYNIAFSLSFDTKFIPTGSILFVLGFQSFFWGSLLTKQHHIQTQKDISQKAINNTALSIIVILLCLAFLLSGGVQYYRNVYFYRLEVQNSGLLFQIMALLHAFSIVAIATEFYNKVVDRDYRINIILTIAITIVIFLMLFAGNRTLASQLALPVLGLYTMYFKRVGFLSFIGFSLLGIIMMFVVQISRSGKDFASVEDSADILVDLTIPTRSTYSCMEYVEEHGHLHGKNLMGGIIGTVPSLERILVGTIGLNSREIGSAEILTDYTLGPNPYVGLGTNILADIFLSFDLIGSMILMFLLGVFVSKQQQGALKLNYYAVVTYASLLSFSLYLVRTTYTHPTKLIVWCLIIALLNKSLSQKLFDQNTCEA